MKNKLSIINYLWLTFSAIFSMFTLASDIPTEPVVDYDIVYVRYNIDPSTNTYIKLPQGENPYDITPGADLMLLKPDGTEIVLVNCENNCSVMDPTISFDAKTVYYSYIEIPDSDHPNSSSTSWLYKIQLDDPDFAPIRLTFNDGFDSRLYATNNNDRPDFDQNRYRQIRDMAPIPLADGRLLFTSNRSGLTALDPSTSAHAQSSVQQLYTMEDHDGSLNTSTLSQIKRLETGTLHLAQHPIQLKDGRILFSSWQDVANRYRYAMTPLFTVNPDGTNLTQFTEPHDKHRNVEHFITQLPDERVVSGSYYPSFDFGFGVLLRYPIKSDGPDFLREYAVDGGWREYRDFSRKGTQNLTKHTTGFDIPAFEIDGVAQGKYSMPSVTLNGDLLTAYSQGWVNHFGAVCAANNKCEDLRSGIYIIPDAETGYITNKDQLIMVKDDPLYNEIWPKPVVTYQAIYGIEKPAILAPQPESIHIKTAQAVGLVGTSSMYNRQSSPSLEENDPNSDLFESDSSSRLVHEGNWTFQGADAGFYNNSDIYGVRIISTPPKPFTKVIDGSYPPHAERHAAIKPYLLDSRLQKVVARYGSLHSERWEIMGEFPLTNTEKTDLQGNPDTSWVAKVPADTPFLIQTIDKNGMTLNSELTWRGLKSGEVRTDCGGCHAHSIEALEFSTTATEKNLANPENITAAIMAEISGVNYNDARLRNGLWDLSTSTPLLVESDDKVSVAFNEAPIVGIEFNRDIQPILDEKCISCHTTDGAASDLLLDGSGELNSYLTITTTGKPEGGSYQMPQASRYIRIPQARQSLLAWVVWGKRLDGRENDDRAVDIDYTEAIHNAHSSIVISDYEKRTVARWIDMGSPIDFPETNGMGYTDDNQLPIINIKVSEDNKTLTVGFIDAHSSINWSSVNVSVNPVTIPAENSVDESVNDSETETDVDTLPMPSCTLSPKHADQINGIYQYDLAIGEGADYLIEVEVFDAWGNKGIASKKLKN